MIHLGITTPFITVTPIPPKVLAISAVIFGGVFATGLLVVFLAGLTESEVIGFPLIFAAIAAGRYASRHNVHPNDWISQLKFGLACGAVSGVVATGFHFAVTELPFFLGLIIGFTILGFFMSIVFLHIATNYWK